MRDAVASLGDSGEVREVREELSAMKNPKKLIIVGSKVYIETKAGIQDIGLPVQDMLDKGEPLTYDFARGSWQRYVLSVVRR